MNKLLKRIPMPFLIVGPISLWLLYAMAVGLQEVRHPHVPTPSPLCVLR